MGGPLESLVVHHNLHCHSQFPALLRLGLEFGQYAEWHLHQVQLLVNMQAVGVILSLTRTHV